MPERIEELYDIIQYCQDHRITPVLITTPFSRYYRELISQDFLQEFQDTVMKIAADTGVNYYDYSHDGRFYDNLDYFSDSDHLNEDGARYFTDILWNEVGGAAALPKVKSSPRRCALIRSVSSSGQSHPSPHGGPCADRNPVRPLPRFLQTPPPAALSRDGKESPARGRPVRPWPLSSDTI